MWTNAMENGKAKADSILLADPDETVRLLIREYLEAQGHPVKDAGTGAEAFRLAGSWGGSDPKVLVTALRLPDGTGDGLADLLRRRHQSGMAVVYLVYDEMSAAVLEGGDRHVQKPFSVLQLKEAIDEALECARGSAAGPSSLAGFPRPRMGYEL